MSALPVVLVTGATGVQGGAVAKELLASKKYKVRALVRSLEAPAAKALASNGAELVVGDFDDEASIEKAVTGAYGVFSIQKHDGNAQDQAYRLIDASKKAGVQVFVQTTVASTGLHTTFPGWGTGEVNEGYWNIKHNTEERVKASGFPNFTILQPAVFFENFLFPRQLYFYPNYKNGVVEAPFTNDFKLQWLSSKDIGVWALHIFNSPSQFNGKSIGLGEDYTLVEITKALSEELGKEVKYQQKSVEELLAAGYIGDYVKACALLPKIGGYNISHDLVKSSNIPYAGLKWFINEHKSEL